MKCDTQWREECLFPIRSQHKRTERFGVVVMLLTQQRDPFDIFVLFFVLCGCCCCEILSFVMMMMKNYYLLLLLLLLLLYPVRKFGRRHHFRRRSLWSNSKETPQLSALLLDIKSLLQALSFFGTALHSLFSNHTKRQSIAFQLLERTTSRTHRQVFFLWDLSIKPQQTTSKLLRVCRRFFSAAFFAEGAIASFSTFSRRGRLSTYRIRRVLFSGYITAAPHVNYNGLPKFLVWVLKKDFAGIFCKSFLICQTVIFSYAFILQRLFRSAGLLLSNACSKEDDSCDPHLADDGGGFLRPV